eukprot:6917647-Pyramimonas_sp.AAC.1
MCTDDRRPREELYEVPGGDQVDGSPPVPVRAGTHGSVYLVELFGVDELEEFGRGVQLVGRPGPDGQCANFGS